MTEAIATIAPETDLRQGAQQLLEHPGSCLLVVEQDQLVGILTETDLLRAYLIAYASSRLPLKVQDYMQSMPHTATLDERLRSAYGRMCVLHIRHLPIVYAGQQLMGILSDRDVRQAERSTDSKLAARERADRLDELTVRDVMTTPVYTVSRDTSIADAGQRLLEHQIGCLPVVYGGNQLEGILTVTDLIRAYVSQAGFVAMEAEAPWYETFFDHHYQQGFASFTTPDITQRQVTFMVKALHLAPHSRILDLGCGTGRHSLALGERGFQVVGLDLSETLLAQARHEGQQRWFPIEFVQGDMRALPYENHFDAVICYFSTFGYFDDADNRRVLEQVSAALKPGGQLLLDLNNRDHALHHLSGRRWWPGEGDAVLLEEIHFDAQQSRFTHLLTLIEADGSRYHFPPMRVRAYALHELIQLCTDVGLNVLDVYGSDTGEPYHPQTSPRFILVADKRDSRLTL
jgi:CBS domain-containing protein/SAM-dependent methyltransferase